MRLPVLIFLVPEVGLEPTRPQWPRDFKSLVSTDSTIQACGADFGCKDTTFCEYPCFFLRFFNEIIP